MNNSFASLMLAQFEAATSADDYMLPFELGAAASSSPKARLHQLHPLLAEQRVHVAHNALSLELSWVIRVPSERRSFFPFT